ncbi:MAG: hypothetical protein LKF01_00245 [Lactobacillus sp.]|jgi:ribosomal protein L24E|nr:hypothetical protein [Lactobacillus sp.]MCH4067973.1 hypothetical protein [Lactobacillus sp.]MCI1304071.1 hypothetical protein [Lactobacillus sp.]MCI1329903.1 hypothetical protein [Lactobacillus sp.]MCI1399503.1 hypothetical protein [Lactobacillus sp.]
MTCDNCGEEIPQGQNYYYIQENHVVLDITGNDIFCSKECILKYLMVDEDISDGESVIDI